MVLVFFLINYQKYKYPSEFSRDCAQGVNGADLDGYYSENHHDNDIRMDATFCADYNNDWLRFRGYTDKTYWSVSTNGGGRSGGCDRDGKYGCCSINDQVQDFFAHRCYPFWFTLEADCYGEKDYIEVLYKDTAITSHAFKCSSYDNCKGFYYGDNCQYSVSPYNENKNCKVSLGREGNGDCIWTNCTEMQLYCLSRHFSNKGVKYYFREDKNGTWIEIATLLTIHLQRDSICNNNQYKMKGKIIIPNNTQNYYFQLVTKTPATLKIGSEGNVQFLHNNLPGLIPSTLNYGQPSHAGPIDYEIIIDSGCSINRVDTELKWSNTNSEFSSIDNDYLSI